MPVPEDQLPVELPDLKGSDLKPKGVSPLAAAEDWVNVSCPTCGGAAKRDSDTMDTFVDSSWYYLRYLDARNSEAICAPEAAAGLPVDVYIGGIEHAVLHLLYARFVGHFLHGVGLAPEPEPFGDQRFELVLLALIELITAPAITSEHRFEAVPHFAQGGVECSHR